MLSFNHRSPCSLADKCPGLFLAFLVVVLGFLLASYPVRNSDIWLHLARGRLLAQGTSSSTTEPDLGLDPSGNPTWLFDFLCYSCYHVLGETALVLGKALLAAGIALLLLWRSRLASGWCVSAVCTSLAILTMSPYLLLQPATISYLFLALLLVFILEANSSRSAESQSSERSLCGLSPSALEILLLLLFVVWANVDRWFLLGLGVAALTWLGEVVDGAFASAALPNRLQILLFRRSLTLVLLTGGCLFNPSHFRAFALTNELYSGNISPFGSNYFSKFGLSPASLAYFLLLGFSFISFVAVLPRLRWRRFLPWLGLGLLSAVQARAVPFFALVAAPVLAWNTVDILARLRSRAGSASEEQGPALMLATRIGAVSSALLLLVLVICAWPGWLQGPPFGPRRWTFELPQSLESGALAVRRWHEEGKLPTNSGGLHLSAETVYAFAWFCPGEKRLRLTAQGSAAEWRQRMRSAGVNYVLVYDTNRDRLSMVLSGLVVDPEQWPLLYQEGDLAIFGWRDPSSSSTPPERGEKKVTDLFRDWQLDLDRLAFHPAEDKKAPPQAPDPQTATRSWWEVFWKSAPVRSIDQDEALLHLLHAEALQRIAPLRHLSRWENSQSVGLVGAASTWASPSALCDSYIRLVLLQSQPSPSLPSSPSGKDRMGDSVARSTSLERMAVGLQRRFVLQQDDAPPALYYLAVRAARRALTANPEDAASYLLLGEGYLGLLHATRERGWRTQLQQVAQLRQAQASAAFNRALALRPDFLQAHLHLGRLYQEMGYLDLALEHLRAYCRLARGAGPSLGISAEEHQARQAHNEEEVERLATEVKKREDSAALASAGGPTRDRAFQAFQNGLAGKALDLLLGSHLSAFGNEGMELELELLLGVGRAQDVQQWLYPEHENALGSTAYHWFLGRAAAASGNYVAAAKECIDAARSASTRSDRLHPLPLRQSMATEIAAFLLNGQISRDTSLAYLSVQIRQAALIAQLQNQTRLLRQQADLSVLRGLLALERGESEEAESAFRFALALWKDETTAALGGGLDFNGRTIAQCCLHWLE